LIDRCLLRALCRAEGPGDLQPTDPAPLAGNRASGLAGKYAEGFAGHIGLPIGQGSNSPLKTSTYGQPPGWPDASCWPRGPSALPAKWARQLCRPERPGDLRASRPGRLAANRSAAPRDICGKFFGGDRQRFLKIANDPCRGSTIANDRSPQLNDLPTMNQRSADDSPGRFKTALS